MIAVHSYSSGQSCLVLRIDVRTVSVLTNTASMLTACQRTVRLRDCMVLPPCFTACHPSLEPSTDSQDLDQARMLPLETI